MTKFASWEEKCPHCEKLVPIKRELPTETITVTQPPTEVIKEVTREVENPELTRKLEEFKAKVVDLEKTLATERRELPMHRMLENWEVVSKHIEDCPECHPVFNEQIFPKEAAKRGFVPKLTESEPPLPKSEPPKAPDRATWLLEEASKRKVKSPMGRRELRREFDEKFKGEA